MKNCIACNNVLSDEATHCYACDTEQTTLFGEFEPKPVYSDTFLKVLCWWTVAGTVIGLFTLPSTFNSMTQAGMDDAGTITATSLAEIILKLLGAVFMLNKRLTGLYLYSAGAVAGIATSLWISFTITSVLGAEYEMLIGLVSLIFPIAFLIMFWLPVNRRHLS